MREGDTMNKIILRFQLAIIYVSVFTFPASAPDTLLNTYGLWVINNLHTFEITVAARTGNGMADLKKTIALLEFDLRYATRNNFTGQRLYPNIRTVNC